MKSFPLAFVIALLSVTLSPASSTVKSPPSPEAAYRAAINVLTSGNKSQIPDKRVGPVRVLLTCGQEAQRQLVVDAVAEINDIFGYGKLALSEEETARVEDDAIVVYIGPKRRGRELVEDFGVSSPRAFRNGVYYYWWDPQRSHHIRSGIVALDELTSPELMAGDLRCLLLASLGYPGVNVTAPHESSKERSKGSNMGPVKFVSDTETAIIRFSDKHIPPATKAWQIRNIIEKEWPDFSAAFWNPSEKTSFPN